MRVLVACVFAPLLTAGCASELPQMPWEHPSIVEVAPKQPPLPLTPPTHTVKGGSGPADAHYPDGFGATVQADGRILFPQGTAGRLKGGDVVAGDRVVATLAPSGEVSGKGLKRKYHFTAAGDLLDAEGRGVRLSPTGGVRAIGGRWHYQDVMQWKAESGEWDKSGWRGMAIVSLIVVENLLPEALRE